MIECILFLSKTGILRILKIYTEDETKIDRKQLVENVMKSINNSSDTQIIYDFDYFGSKRRLVYRSFGSIYIAFVSDELENELALLDFINVMMKVLDEIFKGICELHIIMNPEKIYLAIDEMVSGGMVIEVDKTEIIKAYTDKIKEDENYKYFNY